MATHGYAIERTLKLSDRRSLIINDYEEISQVKSYTVANRIVKLSNRRSFRINWEEDIPQTQFLSRSVANRIVKLSNRRSFRINWEEDIPQTQFVSHRIKRKFRPSPRYFAINDEEYRLPDDTRYFRQTTGFNGLSGVLNIAIFNIKTLTLRSKTIPSLTMTIRNSISIVGQFLPSDWIYRRANCD